MKYYYMKPNVLTAILTCMIVCLFITTITSCSAQSYEVTYLTDTNVNVETKDITLITSQTELSDYINSSRFSKAGNNVIEKLQSYSPDFFNNKTLIVINLKEVSGSNKITVEKIDFNNSEAVVTLKRKTPDISDTSIKIWSIFIDVNIREIKAADYVFH